MTKIRVLIADDHGVVRGGLRALFATEDDIEVVAEAEDGDSAVAMAQETKPHVAIVDIEMPGTAGIEATRRIRETCPDTKVLILSMHDDPALVRDAMAAGSSGYVLKKAVSSELVTAIRAVFEGRSYLNVSLSKNGREEVTTGTHKDLGAEASYDRLSQREREVLEMLAYGYTNQEIGEKLHVSKKTIGTYRMRLSEKLGLENRAEIVRYALEHDLLDKENLP